MQAALARLRLVSQGVELGRRRGDGGWDLRNGQRAGVDGGIAGL